MKTLLALVTFMLIVCPRALPAQELTSVKETSGTRIVIGLGLASACVSTVLAIPNVMNYLDADPSESDGKTGLSASACAAAFGITTLALSHTKAGRITGAIVTLAAIGSAAYAIWNIQQEPPKQYPVDWSPFQLQISGRF